MLAQFIAHAERFGPECVLETATLELDSASLGQLKGFLDTKQRVYVWENVCVNGAWRARWKPRRDAERPCAHCGLELPPATRRDTRYHAHCRKAAYRARMSVVGVSGAQGAAVAGARDTSEQVALGVAG